MWLGVESNEISGSSNRSDSRHGLTPDLFGFQMISDSTSESSGTRRGSAFALSQTALSARDEDGSKIKLVADNIQVNPEQMLMQELNSTKKSADLNLFQIILESFESGIITDRDMADFKESNSNVKHQRRNSQMTRSRSWPLALNGILIILNICQIH